MNELITRGVCVQSLIVVVIDGEMNLNNSHLGGVYTQRVHRAVRGFAQEKVLISPFIKGVR